MPLIVAGLKPSLVSRLSAAAGPRARTLRCSLPAFKSIRNAEIEAPAGGRWLTLSITGGHCDLQCDHCRARILEPMLAVRSPEALWETVSHHASLGASGMLLSGGSNRRGEVEYGPFLDTLARIGGAFPDFVIAAHTGLSERCQALALADAGVRIAMMDVIGAQETVRKVYHLKRPVADYEHALAALCETRMRVVPHIVIGLHYGRMLGEYRALEIIARHPVQGLVLVVVMPQHAHARRPFSTPAIDEVAEFMACARERLPELPIHLGCARPPGQIRVDIEACAVIGGLDSIAHPLEDTVRLAREWGRSIRVSGACCSVDTLPLTGRGAVDGAPVAAEARRALRVARVVPIHAL